MKKMMVVLALFLSLQLSSTAQVPASLQKYSFTNLVGSWRTSKGTGLDVVDSNTIYVVNGAHRKLVTSTTADFSKNPAWFNLSVKDDGKVVTLKSLLMFVNEDMLQWQVFDTETKPAAYNEARRGDMLFLKRVKQLEN